MPRVAVITVSYRSDRYLDDFLHSVGESGLAPEAVIVADNAPDDEGAARITSRHGAGYLPMEGNLGYGGAINRAESSLDPSIEWILISNPDVVLGPDALSELVDAGESDPHAGSIGPLVRNSDGSVYPSARTVPSLRIGVGHAILGRPWPTNPFTREYHGGAQEGRRSVGWLSGSCLLVRRSAFRQIGGFDEGFFMYFEDVDLGYRLGKSGWLNVYDPDAEVVHTGAHSTESSNDMLRAHHLSAERFIAKKYRGRILAPLRLALIVGLRVRSSIVSARAGQPSSNDSK